MKKLLKLTRRPYPLFKYDLKMKISTLFILVTLFTVQANDTYGQRTDITLNLNYVSVGQLIDEIESSTEFQFVYKIEDIDLKRIVSINAKKEKIANVLSEIFQKTKTTFNLNDRRIYLVRRRNTISSSLVKQSNFQSAQQIVSGIVADENGAPLVGASIVEKGTVNGTQADFDGKFSLEVLDVNSTLIISYIGFTTQEILLNGQTALSITLQEDTAALDEVVVVGYGTNKKINLTGAISTVSAEEINTSTTTNMADKLTGKLPGLRVMQRTSEPGNYDSNFDIRGWGNPLIIVDGIARGENFSKIDPNEVESITVLKDASAAVYGVKAANGVILVTTKKGKQGKVEISYSGTYGIQEVTDFPKPMSAAQFAESFNWARVNSGQTPEYSAEEVAAYKSGELQGTNWWDVAMNNSAPQQQHNLTFTGGSEKMKFFTSLGYLEEEGLFKTGDLNYARYNLRSNIEAQLTENLSAELLIGAIADKKSSPSYWMGGVFKGIWMQKPTFSYYANDTAPYYQNMADGNHPAVVTNSDLIGNSDTKNKTFQGTFSLNYKVPYIDGLNAKLLFAYDVNHFYNRRFDKKYNLYDYDVATGSYITHTNNSPSRMSSAYAESEKSTTQFHLNYEKTIADDHNVKGLLLYEYLTVANDNFNGERQFSVDAIDQLYAGNSEQTITADSNNVFETNNQGIVGRLNYDFQSKYLVEASFRYDGSSMFPKGKRWGFFPSASVGWRLSEENFIKEKVPSIDNLKIRASWGKMGDDSAARFQFVPGYVYPTSNTIGGGPLGSVFNGNFVTGLSPIGMVNPNITWYTAITSNIGVDASLWGDGLTITFDAFKRKRDGLLTTRLLSLPQSVGASLPQENLNSDISKGFEIQLGTTQKIGDLVIGLSGMLSYTKLKWDYKEEAEAGNSYLNWRNTNSGRYNNVIWGYDDIGQFQNQEEINTAPITDGQGNRWVRPGDLIYSDLNNDGMIDDWDVNPIAQGNADMEGQSIPEITYGLNMSLAWRNFDMSALFQGATNYSVRLIEQLSAPYPWGRNGLSHFYDSWHQADINDPNSEWIPGEYPAARLSGVNPNNRTSSYFIKDASYLRLKSLEIGYTLPEEVLKKVGVKQCRVFVNGFNLLTWSGLSFMDPEHPQDQYGYMYPITRNLNLGINVSF